MTLREKFRRLAREALDKPARYGPDVDVRKYVPQAGRREEELSPQLLARIGIDVSEKTRTGSYYQLNEVVLKAYSRVPGLKVLSLEEALDMYPDLMREYYWRAVSVNEDKYTAAAELAGRGGYVIIAKRGARIPLPVQTCLLMTESGLLQAPHNIIIAEEGAELAVITGCAAMREVAALHAGVSEFYVMEGAKVTFVMIHSWSSRVHVRPRTGAIVEEGGCFVSQYVNLSPVASIQSYPEVRLAEGARAHVSSLVLASGSGVYDLGARIDLLGAGASGEIVSRAIVKDDAKYVARALIIARAGGVRGHTECSALLLSERAEARAVPELGSTTEDAELTHEASIGKIAREKVEYLMARGFSEQEAVSLIVRGFMKVDVEELPDPLKNMISEAAKIIAKKAL